MDFEDLDLVENSEVSTSKPDEEFDEVAVYSVEFVANGSYKISIKFNDINGILDSIIFEYKGIRFSCDLFLSPYFTDITDIKIYEKPYLYRESYCFWDFIVKDGHVISAFYTTEDYSSLINNQATPVKYDLITKTQVVLDYHPFE